MNSIIKFYDDSKTDSLYKLIMGCVGSGHAFRIKSDILYALEHTEDQIIAIDTDGEFNKLCEEMGGVVIDMASYINNPLDILTLDIPEDIKIDYVVNMFEFINMRQLSNNEKAVLVELCKTYFNKEDAPTVREFIENFNVEENESYPAALASFVDACKSLCHDTNLITEPYNDITSCKTNIPDTTNKRFVVFDTRNVMRTNKMQYVTLCAVTGAWKVVAECNHKKDCRVYLHDFTTLTMPHENVSLFPLINLGPKNRMFKVITTIYDYEGFTEGENSFLDKTFGKNSNNTEIIFMMSSPLDRIHMEEYFGKKYHYHGISEAVQNLSYDEVVYLYDGAFELLDASNNDPFLKEAFTRIVKMKNLAIEEE